MQRSQFSRLGVSGCTCIGRQHESRRIKRDQLHLHNSNASCHDRNKCLPVTGYLDKSSRPVSPLPLWHPWRPRVPRDQRSRTECPSRWRLSEQGCSRSVDSSSCFVRAAPLSPSADRTKRYRWEARHDPLTMHTSRLHKTQPFFLRAFILGALIASLLVVATPQRAFAATSVSDNFNRGKWKPRGRLDRYDRRRRTGTGDLQ